MSSRKKFKTVPEYIDAFPKDVQKLLRDMRRTIRKAAPDAQEAIGYGIPAYKLRRPVIYFAAFKNHIGLYPMTSTVKKEFKKELSVYKQGKGTVQFPLDKPIPLSLVARIVKFRVKENLAKQ
ncbi:MAG: DUF1801 domain-containing protein [Candidatus Andersenbacteria bacterium]